MPKKAVSKKKYVPNSKEKYMCAKHKKFFTDELLSWKKDIIKANNLGNILNSSDDNVSSADIVDQASSYTDKSVEMKALNRSRKLISKINAALQRLKEGTYGYCEETGEEIGLKRELEEEFNIKASVENYLTESFYEYDNVKINLKAYFVKDFLGDIKLTDHDKVEWINIDELKNYDFAPADIPINDYLVKNGI